MFGEKESEGKFGRVKSEAIKESVHQRKAKVFIEEKLG